MYRNSGRSTIEPWIDGGPALARGPSASKSPQY